MRRQKLSWKTAWQPVVDSLGEVREYLEDMGADVDGMSDEELEEASEVFALPDGKYLIVEG